MIGPNQMIETKKEMKLHGKLMTARLRLQGTKLSKSGHNKFAGYQYFELGDFLPVIQTIFFDLGLCGIVSYTKELATLTIYDSGSADTITITSPMASAALKGCHEVQNLGAVETYQRRYLWITAMEIVEHDALDSSPGVDATPRSKPVTHDVWDNMTPEEQKWLQGIADSVRAELEAKGGAAALKVLEEQGLEADHKVGIWSRFDSKERAAMKPPVQKRAA